MAAQNQALECNVVQNIHGSRLLAKFLVHDWGNKVDSGIGLLYRPARLHRLAGHSHISNENPKPESTIYPIQGL